MWPVSAAFAAAVAEGASQVWRVTLNRDGETLELTTAVNDDAAVIDLTVTMAANADHRSSCTLSIVDPDSSLLPRNLGDWLAPPTEISISAGVRLLRPVTSYITVGSYAGGDAGLPRTLPFTLGAPSLVQRLAPVESTVEYVPLFVGGISEPTVTETPRDLTLAVVCYDRSKRVARNRWVDPYTVANGTERAAALMALIADRDPRATFAFEGDATELPERVFGLETENDPWQDALTLARPSRRLFVDRTGRYALQQVPDPDTAAVSATYTNGRGVTGLSRVISDEQVYNGVKGKAEGAHLAAPLVSYAWDTNRNSPTYAGVFPDGSDDPAGSAFGKRPRFWTTSLASTQGELDTGTESLLRSSLGADERLTLTVLPNPAIDPDDVLAVTRPRLGIDNRYAVDQVVHRPRGEATRLECRQRELR